VFGRRHVTPIVASFLDAYPGVRVEMVLDDRNRDLVGEVIDVTLRNRSPTGRAARLCPSSSPTRRSMSRSRASAHMTAAARSDVATSTVGVLRFSRTRAVGGP
jgi:DNA-binding transcriptional LysR family regulator